MIERILPNLYKIEIPLPKNPLRALNSYVIKSKDRNLIIDTGLNQEECMNAMRSGLKEIDVDLSETDFFITHLHPDHLDLVQTLSKESSTIYFNKPDADDIDTSDKWDDGYHYFARLSGFPENQLQEVIERYSGHKYSGWEPEFTILKEGDTISIENFLFRCVETQGHTRGHMCLYESKKKILVAGDHILNDITPNISLWVYEGNPLNDYLASLDKVYKFDIQLVLPGHRSLFKSCRERIRELKHHHHARANEVLSILKKGSKDAFQIASQMSWDMAHNSWDLFPMPQKLFATTEAIAHLKYLEEKGSIQKEIKGQRMVFSLK